MLPRAECYLLVRTLLDALSLAERGHPTDGYDHLVLGLLHAQEAQEDHEPWAETLIQSYDLLLEDYSRRFGVWPTRYRGSRLLRR